MNFNPMLLNVKYESCVTRGFKDLPEVVSLSVKLTESV